MGKDAGLWYVYIGNVPDNKQENTYCHSCGELLAERNVFEIVKNRIKSGRCPECGSQIPGSFGG
jgi:pyruvate formate lyase activating enzyme